jgi:hypothetical protein
MKDMNSKYKGALKQNLKVRDVAQWFSVCLAYMKPWI